MCDIFALTAWMCLCGLKGDDGDFGWAVEPEGQAYGADAPIDVELHAVEGVAAFGVFASHGWEDERSGKGEPDLAAVGVAGEHEVDETAFGVGGDGVGVVGLVSHKDDGGVGVVGNGEVQVGMAGAGVVDAAEPEVGTVALEGKVLVDEERGAVGGEGLGDQGGVEGDVVVAEAAVSEGSGEAGEDLGAAADGMVAGDEGHGAVGDEVSREEDDVWIELVDLVDDALEEEGFGELVEVDVADLHDAVAEQGCGQVGDADEAVGDVDLVAGDLAGVEG